MTGMNMELIPINSDYDQLSQQVRTFSANALYDMIGRLHPYVIEAFSDPAGMHDLEPSRLVAYTQLLKVHAALIKDLGLLYRVQDRPLQDGEEQIPASAVAVMLAEAEQRHAQELAQATQAAQMLARTEFEAKERRSLEDAKAQVAGQLARMRRGAV